MTDELLQELVTNADAHLLLSHQFYKLQSVALAIICLGLGWIAGHQR